MKRWFVYAKMLRNSPIFVLHEDGRCFVAPDGQTREWREKERMTPEAMRRHVEALVRGSMYAVVETTDPNAEPVWPESEQEPEASPPTAFADVTPDTFFAAVPLHGFKMPKTPEDEGEE